MNAETYTKRAAEVLDALVDTGMTPREVKAFAKFAAESLDKLDRGGFSVDDLLDAGSEKHASAVAAILGGAAGLGTAALDRIGRLGENTASALVQGTVRNAPLLAVGGLALPAVAGYMAGDTLNRIQDKPEENVEVMQHRELVNALREQARLANQHRRLVQETSAAKPKRKRSA
jgi:hypothetical protein